MYLNDLPAIESWTSAQMGGKAGACIPETMRFNGNGYYNGGNNTQNASCATASSPSYNAENITSGAELSMWIWQQYQDTGSLSFLQTYYPILEQTATFLLADQTVGSDGYLHATANAHETQWAVTDPTDDLVADQALFPAVVSAATLLNTDSSLVSQLKTAENEIEPYARASQSSLTLLNSQPTSASAAASADAAGNDVIADSYQPSATLHNSENIGLEPVWPWGVIGDNTTVNGDNLTALADRTYNSRPNGTTSADWNFDAVDAARLDMPSQVESDLIATTENYQVYIDGMATFSPPSTDEPYIEQAANVATTIDEAFATDYDGTLRIAPAWPSGWDGSGSVYIQGNSKVDVQVESGTITTVAIQAGHHRDHERAQPLVRAAGRGRQRLHRRGRRLADHGGDAERAGHRRLVLPGRADLLAHHVPAVRPGHRHPGHRVQVARRQGADRYRRRLDPEAPYGGTPAAVPGTVQAENYDTGGQGVAYNVSSVNGSANSYRSDGVDLESTSDTGGGDDLGWTGTGQWFNYTVNVATAGTYTVGLRLAAPNAVTDGLHIANSSGTNLSGDVNIASTGGWQTWATTTATVTLPAGVQTLTVYQDNGGWNAQLPDLRLNRRRRNGHQHLRLVRGGQPELRPVRQRRRRPPPPTARRSSSWPAPAPPANGGSSSRPPSPATTSPQRKRPTEGESWNITGGVGATASGTCSRPGTTAASATPTPCSRPPRSPAATTPSPPTTQDSASTRPAPPPPAECSCSSTPATAPPHSPSNSSSSPDPRSGNVRGGRRNSSTPHGFLPRAGPR
jgi:hypothetical protein